MGLENMKSIGTDIAFEGQAQPATRKLYQPPKLAILESLGGTEGKSCVGRETGSQFGLS